MIVVVIMLVVLWFDAAIFVNNGQFLRGFELALDEFVCFLCTGNFLKNV
mgnify:CR=1 FL=1